jgi:hypothetical protein
MLSAKNISKYDTASIVWYGIYFALHRTRSASSRSFLLSMFGCFASALASCKSSSDAFFSFGSFVMMSDPLRSSSFDPALLSRDFCSEESGAFLPSSLVAFSLGSFVVMSEAFFSPSSDVILSLEDLLSSLPAFLSSSMDVFRPDEIVNNFGVRRRG